MFWTINLWNIITIPEYEIKAFSFCNFFVFDVSCVNSASKYQNSTNQKRILKNILLEQTFHGINVHMARLSVVDRICCHWQTVSCRHDLLSLTDCQLSTWFVVIDRQSVVDKICCHWQGSVLEMTCYHWETASCRQNLLHSLEWLVSCRMIVMCPLPHIWHMSRKEIDDKNYTTFRNFTTKKNDFNFLIVNFPFICSNIPAAPVYGVYISELIRYSRGCVPIRISLIDGCG